MPSDSLIAVDVGNAQMKLGAFADNSAAELPEPTTTLRLDGSRPELDRIPPWLDAIDPAELNWSIGSVNRPSATRLIDWLREHRPNDRITMLAVGDLPLTVSLERPDMVGIDRLLNAVAANSLRRPNRPAVVVDVGSAITVDAISAEGHFTGGAILPGIGMSARALHEFTDLLPLIGMSELATPPPALGSATLEAMRSGLYYGAVGAIRELIGQLASESADVYLTGGAGPAVAELLGRATRHVPHLTLGGIALATR